MKNHHKILIATGSILVVYLIGVYYTYNYNNNYLHTMGNSSTRPVSIDMGNAWLWHKALVTPQ